MKFFYFFTFLLFNKLSFASGECSNDSWYLENCNTNKIWDSYICVINKGKDNAASLCALKSEDLLKNCTKGQASVCDIHENDHDNAFESCLANNFLGTSCGDIGNKYS